MTALIDWMAQTWADFVDWIQDILAVLLGWLKGFVLDIFELLLMGIVYVFGLITPPQFIVNGLDGVFGALPSDITYFLAQSGLSQGLAIYGAGVSFRLLRKLFTLGQW